MTSQSHKLEHGHTITFNEEKHVYIHNNEYVVGMSTILGKLASPMLENWKINNQVNAIKLEMEKQGIALDKIDSIIINARSNARKQNENILSIGSIVHKLVEKWLKGEDIPQPARPKGPMPKPPLMGCPKEDEEKWIEDYKKWAKENEHLPKLQTAEEILARPRPKTDPPKPPPPNATDEQLEGWVKEYDKWREENEHLPNLQPGKDILARFRQQTQGTPPGAPAGGGLTGDDKARLSRLEQKVDKLIAHLGIK